jgi:hypothetical protein
MTQPTQPVQQEANSWRAIRPRLVETVYLVMILASVIGLTYEWFHR